MSLSSNFGLYVIYMIFIFHIHKICMKVLIKGKKNFERFFPVLGLDHLSLMMPRKKKKEEKKETRIFKSDKYFIEYACHYMTNMYF